MAKVYPMKRPEPVAFTGAANATTTDQAAQYKNLLGAQVASVEVGLFYQLNQTSVQAEKAAEEDIGNYKKGDSRLFNNIKNYGNYANPIEAGGEYA